MKTLKLIICIILVCSCSIFAQTPTPTAPPAKLDQSLKPAGSQMQGLPGAQPGQQPAKLNRYMVQIPHTKEQCQTVMNEMKEKGAISMRFDWGCASGEHIGFAMLPGTSEEAVLKQLPDGVQKMAKLTKVERANSAQMEQLHK